MWGLLTNTLALVFAVIALTVPVGTVTAWLLVGCEWPGRRRVACGLGMLLFLPLYLQATAWDAVVGRQGWVGVWLGGGGVPLLGGWFAVVFIHACALLPWVVLIVGLAVREVEPELVEQGLLDMPPGTVFWRVVLPRCQAGMAVAAAWVAVSVASEMTVSDMYRVRTFAEALYTDFALDEEYVSIATRLGPGIGVLAGLVLGLLALARSWRPFSSATLRRRSVRVVWGGYGVTVALGSLVALLLLVPWGGLLVKLGGVATRVDGRWLKQWSLTHAMEVLAATPRDFAAELGWTAGLAALAATLCFLVSTPLGWWIRRSDRGTFVVFAASAVLATVPGPYIAVLVMAARVHWGGEWLEALAERSLFLPAAVLGMRAIPLGVALSWRAWRTIPQAVLDAATLDGLSAMRQLVQVAMRLRLRSLAAIWLVAWVQAAGDVAATILLIPTRVSTVSIRTFQLAHAGVDDRLAGLCLLATIVFGGLAGCVFWMVGRERAWE